MITVQVWDKSRSAPSSAPSANPISGSTRSSKAQLLRMPIPELNEERRQEIGQGRAQICRAGARRGAQCSPRRHGAPEEQEKDGDISKDEHQSMSDQGAETDRQDDQGDRRDARGQGSRDHAGLAGEPAPRAMPSPYWSTEHVTLPRGAGWSRPRCRHLGMSPSSWMATAAGQPSAGLPRAEGHRQGVESVRRTVRAALELGIRHLTLFSFSSENWSRPRQEISDLFGLMRRFIRRDLAELHQNGVRVRSSATAQARQPTSAADRRAERLTKDNSALNLRSPSTMAPATRSRAPPRASPRPWPKAPRRRPISRQSVRLLSRHRRITRSRPPHPHERRVPPVQFPACGRLAYSEFVFVDTYWPDFSRETLEAAIAEYQRRTRRFGGLKARSTA